MMYHYESNIEQRTRRWRQDCLMGENHQLDVFQNRQLWMDGEMHDLYLCSWCGTWSRMKKAEGRTIGRE